MSLHNDMESLSSQNEPDVQAENQTEETAVETVTLDEEFMVLAVPASTVELKLTAKVWYNGEVFKVGRNMSFEEVREAIKEAQHGYIPSLGREEAEMLKEKYRDTEDE